LGAVAARRRVAARLREAREAGSTSPVGIENARWTFQKVPPWFSKTLGMVFKNYRDGFQKLPL
jgi:hypothetical protein